MCNIGPCKCEHVELGYINYCLVELFLSFTSLSNCKTCWKVCKRNLVLRTWLGSLFPFPGSISVMGLMQQILTFIQQHQFTLLPKLHGADFSSSLLWAWRLGCSAKLAGSCSTFWRVIATFSSGCTMILWGFGNCWPSDSASYDRRQLSGLVLCLL